MIPHPAIAMFELNSIPAGTEAADAMVKRAPIELLRIGTVQPGKYVILIGGSVAAVEESYIEGRRVAGDALMCQIMLPDVHEDVYESVNGVRRPNDGDALGIMETSTIPAIVLAADKAVKMTDIVLVEIRLGDGLGGKGVMSITGKLEDVQESIAAGLASLKNADIVKRSVVIPAQHAELRDRVDQSGSFYPQA